MLVTDVTDVSTVFLIFLKFLKLSMALSPIFTICIAETKTLFRREEGIFKAQPYRYK